MSEPSSSEQMQEAVILSVPLRPADVARLDQSADRRGVTRETLIVEAVDAFLAREMWSGGFIPPPPPMEVPSKFPWGPGAFRLRRRD
ncbi:MAG TPA: hypothetical protein VMY16_16445 [Ilumatobacteraceae bacterium]|nr:hypothetical protein [Ilumatobacteraceae bacterium]